MTYDLDDHLRNDDDDDDDDNDENEDREKVLFDSSRCVEAWVP